jgi:erythrocyte band 7 integral membrane protein
MRSPINRNRIVATKLQLLTAYYSKDARLPVQLQRAMAAEAEAAREARAKVSASRTVTAESNVLHIRIFSAQVIAAEGEQKASRALKEASLVIAESPSALQLRYLQVGGKRATSKRRSTNLSLSFSSVTDTELHFGREELDHHISAAD